MENGIRPIGVYADGDISEDVASAGTDLSGRGDRRGVGRIDVERAAELQPDLVVGDWWPVEKAYSGTEAGVEARSRKIAELAPMVGPSQGDSILGLIEGYRDLAAALGADADEGPGADARARFEKAREAFTAAAEAKPGLTALAISPWDDNYAMAVPKYAPELLDFQRWGLDVIDPAKPDADFPYWQTLSFERADDYQPDLLLFDDRNHPGNLEVLEAQPIARSIKAYAAGAYTTWPAYWLHTYGDHAAQLERLTGVIEKADPDVGT